MVAQFRREFLYLKNTNLERFPSDQSGRRASYLFRVEELEVRGQDDSCQNICALSYLNSPSTIFAALVYGCSSAFPTFMMCITFQPLTFK